MKNYKKTITLLALSAALLSTAGIIAQREIVANAEEETPAVGCYMLEQTDALGRKVTVPVEFDGETYILADYTRNIFVYNGKSATSLNDVVLNTQKYPTFTSKDGVFTDAIAISLYYNLVTAYDFYCEENIGRDYKGLNGKNDDIAGNWKSNGEIPLYVFVHFNADGYQYNAAFTSFNNEGYMIVGDGHPTNTVYDMHQQATALDIIAHEYQHGITHFMIKDLVAEGETGAMDEGISDIFGMLIENKDPFSDENGFWTVGEDCAVTGTPLRSISDPKSIDERYPMSLDEKWECKWHRSGKHDSYCDYNYVHWNSTIVSHLMYTAWEIAPQFFTRENMARLWFNALPHLNANATFQNLRYALQLSAEEQNFDEAAINVLNYSFYINGFTNEEMFKVTFLDEDGTVLYTMATTRGGTVEVPDPVKESTEQYNYVFKGWDQKTNFVLEDMIVTAIFEEELRFYTVQFVYEDGSLIREITLPYGSEIAAPFKPTMASTEEYDYIFVGWRGLSGIVTSDRTVEALFEAQPIEKMLDLGDNDNDTNLPLVIGLAAGVGVGILIVAAVGTVLFVKRKKG